jgi:hypothetical protein
VFNNYPDHQHRKHYRFNYKAPAGHCLGGFEVFDKDNKFIQSVLPTWIPENVIGGDEI